RRENFAFVSEGVLFVGINLVGGEPEGDEGEEEWAARLQENVDWIGEKFTEHASSVRAAVIFGHAGPGESAHDLFFDGFGPLAAAFAKPILYATGDGHSWVVDKPFAQQNVTRLQVERGTEPPAQITVGLDPAAPFEILRDPWPAGTPHDNHAPCVEAGPDVSVDLTGQVDLDGWVVDDGVPGPVATSWSLLSGAGQAVFADPQALQTSVRFDRPGGYLLQLAAHDGERLTTGTLAVDVYVGAPTLTLDDVVVDEGDGARFTVRLFGGRGGAVSVDVASADGSARAP
ncbi:MAG: hypothetical protein GWN79_14370, partial [Actinobacteria bacterium]|nr:hypothetical protein [Actinomycetota bacterium]NIT96500.1 hypothetical protein [Actinomycetota bacterium]NIU20193.1 hypothetical protein [Actinomycetota bacterium]NIU67824.1 hypothetical protein [Actinomycetota bacterium]NIW29591.1 hypothetical protein [Actinomycetota bacterium]